MALASTMNSTLIGSPLMRVSQNGLFVPVNYRLRTSRISTTSVKCMSEVPEHEEMKDLGPLSPPPKPKMSTKFSDVLAFSGPAPERINGRLAMIGFVSAMAVELAKGQNLLSQVSDGGATWFAVSAVVLSLASLIPLFKGVSVESKSDGFMTSDAELWNGRFAMLGLVALALLPSMSRVELLSNFNFECRTLVL